MTLLILAAVLALQKTAVAVAYVKRGTGLLKLNGALRWTVSGFSALARWAAVSGQCAIRTAAEIAILNVNWCWLCAGSPLELVQPDTLRFKVMEPVLLLGKERFSGVDIRIRAKGGGHVSQIYGVAGRLHCNRMWVGMCVSSAWQKFSTCCIICGGTYGANCYHP